MWRTGRAPNSIPVYSYIQQDDTLHSLFICGYCSTCFGWCFHTSSGAHTTVSTASGICQTVTGICRYRGRVGTGLSVLWVAYAPPTHTVTSLVTDHSWKHVHPGNHTVTRGCKGSLRRLLMMDTIVPETCWAVSTRQNNKYKIDCASGWMFYWIFEDARNHKH
jgi:hypothetical protein